MGIFYKKSDASVMIESNLELINVLKESDSSLQFVLGFFVDSFTTIMQRVLHFIQKIMNKIINFILRVFKGEKSKSSSSSSSSSSTSSSTTRKRSREEIQKEMDELSAEPGFTLNDLGTLYVSDPIDIFRRTLTPFTDVVALLIESIDFVAETDAIDLTGLASVTDKITQLIQSTEATFGAKFANTGNQVTRTISLRFSANTVDEFIEREQEPFIQEHRARMKKAQEFFSSTCMNIKKATLTAEKKNEAIRKKLNNEDTTANISKSDASQALTQLNQMATKVSAFLSEHNFSTILNQANAEITEDFNNFCAMAIKRDLQLSYWKLKQELDAL